MTAGTRRDRWTDRRHFLEPARHPGGIHLRWRFRHLDAGVAAPSKWRRSEHTGRTRRPSLTWH